MTQLPELQTKVHALKDSMNSVLVERTREVDCAVNALVGEMHLFLIGPPGVAKSMLSRELVRRIGGFQENDYFEWLMTRYTTPDELFGPMSLAALENDEFKRNPRHKLPLAKVSFLDEIFKANSANLNSLLKIINEREWDNNGASAKVPLSTLFSASNEMPQGEELSALWDRIHFRFYVEPIKDGGNFIVMLNRAAQAVARQDEEEITQHITWDEIEQAKKEVRQIEVPNDVMEAMKMLRDNLMNEGITPSDRRFVEGLKVIRSTAWMNGHSVAEIDDMRLLRHVFWTDLSQQRMVEKLVLELANPIDKEAAENLERLEGLASELDKAIKDSDTSKDLARQAVEIHGKIQTIKDRVNDLQKRSDEAGRESEVLEQLKTRFVSVARKLMSEGFGLSDTSTPALESGKQE